MPILRRCLLPALAAATIAAASPSVLAVPTFSGDLVVTLTVASVDGTDAGAIPAGLGVTASALVQADSSFAQSPPGDSATSSVDADVIQGGVLIGAVQDAPIATIGDGVRIASNVSGLAAAEFASALTEALGAIVIESASPDDVEVVIALAWLLDAGVSGDAATADALVSAFADLDILTPSGFEFIVLEDHADTAADLLFGPVSVSAQGAITRSLVLLSDDLVFVDVAAGLDGHAVNFAAVSEPPVLALLALGLLLAALPVRLHGRRQPGATPCRSGRALSGRERGAAPRTR